MLAVPRRGGVYAKFRKGVMIANTAPGMFPSKEKPNFITKPTTIISAFLWVLDSKRGGWLHDVQVRRAKQTPLLRVVSERKPKVYKSLGKS